MSQNSNPNLVIASAANEISFLDRHPWVKRENAQFRIKDETGWARLISRRLAISALLLGKNGKRLSGGALMFRLHALVSRGIVEADEAKAICPKIELWYMTVYEFAVKVIDSNPAPELIPITVQTSQVQGDNGTRVIEIKGATPLATQADPPSTAPVVNKQRRFVKCTGRGCAAQMSHSNQILVPEFSVLGPKTKVKPWELTKEQLLGHVVCGNCAKKSKVAHHRLDKTLARIEELKKIHEVEFRNSIRGLDSVLNANGTGKNQDRRSREQDNKADKKKRQQSVYVLRNII